MACIKNWWDGLRAWVEKIFDNSPDGTPRKSDKEKESEENKEEK